MKLFMAMQITNSINSVSYRRYMISTVNTI